MAQPVPFVVGEKKECQKKIWKDTDKKCDFVKFINQSEPGC